MLTHSLTHAKRRSGSLPQLTALLASVLVACTPLPLAANPAADQASPQATAANATHPAYAPPSIPPNLIELAQPAGQARLMGAAHKQSYWALSEYFETQRNQAYCSVATAVMALNALRIRPLESTQYPDFPYFSQEDFFRNVDPQVANAAQVTREGMTLDQLSEALSAFPVEVRKFHASDLTLVQFRELIRDTTGHNVRFALLNFKRAEIGESGGGHWSPLAAYDQVSDSALLLDVARYKYPAVWVPVTQLYAGARAVDKVSGLSRGLVIVGGRADRPRPGLAGLCGLCRVARTSTVLAAPFVKSLANIHFD